MTWPFQGHVKFLLHCLNRLFWNIRKLSLVVSTHLRHVSQLGSYLQVGVNMFKNMFQTTRKKKHRYPFSYNHSFRGKLPPHWLIERKQILEGPIFLFHDCGRKRKNQSNLGSSSGTSLKWWSISYGIKGKPFSWRSNIGFLMSPFIWGENKHYLLLTVMALQFQADAFRNFIEKNIFQWY